MAYDSIPNNPVNIDSSKVVILFKSKVDKYLVFIYSEEAPNATVLSYCVTIGWLLEQMSSRMRIAEINQVRLIRNF